MSKTIGHIDKQYHRINWLFAVCVQSVMIDQDANNNHYQYLKTVLVLRPWFMKCNSNINDNP